MKYRLFAAAGVLLAAGSVFAGKYTVTVPLSDDENGAMAFLVNYDSDEKIDSVMVDDNKAVFNGDIAQPVSARLIIDGKRVAQFFVEPDADITVNVSERIAKGGKLNDIEQQYAKQVSELSQKFGSARTDQEKEAVYNEYIGLRDKTLDANLDNMFGYTLFIEKAYDMTPEELDAYLAAHPYFAQFKRVQRLVRSNQAKKSTQPGAMFADFAVEYNGATHRLSDVVGKGNPVVVDFWASWCGPCRREMPNLKEIYDAYSDKGLKVLGVAVWDEPAASEKAVKEMQLPWEVWVNGGSVPTDTYGISGIPCIIYFNGDGTIRFRDLHGADLRKAVDDAMSAAAN